MQPFDYTTFIAVCGELQRNSLPARFEQAYQCDRHTVVLGLRMVEGRQWLALSWHPQAARFHLTDPPPREPDTFTFSKQLQSLLKGLALIHLEPIVPWERVLDLQFAPRPGDTVEWHLYLEIMGQYSNAILVNQAGEIVTAAHQVGVHQSRVRPIQTGELYQPPPALQDAIPRLDEAFEQWQETVALIPGTIARQLVKSYRGVSSALALELVESAGLDPLLPNDRLDLAQWKHLFTQWQAWLNCIHEQRFLPRRTATGYTVWGGKKRSELEGESRSSVQSVQEIVAAYYQQENDRYEFQNLYQQITQKLKGILHKYHQKAQIFQSRLTESTEADRYRVQGDLLMAHLHEWEPGLKQMELLDFETGVPVSIPLDPEKNAAQNAQYLYKQHQKLKRAKEAILPLLSHLQIHLDYLEQVEQSLQSLSEYQDKADLLILKEIADELKEQGYWGKPVQAVSGRKERIKDKAKGKKERSLGATSKATSRDPIRTSQTDFHRYHSPSGYEVLVGRNNRQNDQLSFRVATEYDLWFHTQEIPGSHVLLRLPPGSQPETIDLQYVANVAAYHSRAHQSEQVPVVYTLPKYVYKPKGNPPGLVIYKQEKVLWGKPLTLKTLT